MNWRKAKKAVKKEFQIKHWPGAISPRHLRNICISVQDNVRPLVMEEVHKVKGLPEALMPLAIRQCTAWAAGMLAVATLTELQHALFTTSYPRGCEPPANLLWSMPAEDFEEETWIN